MITGQQSWQIGPEVLVQASSDSLITPHMNTVFQLSACSTPKQKPRYVLYLDAEQTKEGAIRVLADDLPVFHTESEHALPPLLEKTLAHYCARMCEDYAIFHAAFLVKDGHGLLLPGEPGSGKSTLCAYLTQQGFQYYGDDFIFMRFHDCEIHAFPKAITLKRGSFDLVRDEPEYFDHARGAIRYFTPEDAGNNPLSATSLKRIIMPHYVENGINQTQKIDPEVLALAMVQQCFGGLDRDTRMMAMIENLAEQQGFLIEYSSSKCALEAIDTILEDIEG